MSAWRDEVKADMNACVVDMNRSVNPRFLVQIVIVLLVDIALDRIPAFVVINLKPVRKVSHKPHVRYHQSQVYQRQLD